MIIGNIIYIILLIFLKLSCTQASDYNKLHKNNIKDNASEISDVKDSDDDQQSNKDKGNIDNVGNSEDGIVEPEEDNTTDKQISEEKTDTTTEGTSKVGKDDNVDDDKIIKNEKDNSDEKSPPLTSNCIEGPPKMWIKQEDIEVNQTLHQWHVWLPEGINQQDNNHPLVFQLHGCNRDINDKFNSNIPVNQVGGNNAIHIRPLMNEGENCWSHRGEDSQGVALFDALIDKVQNCWRVDRDRLLLVGWSSGAYMSHQLSCLRGDDIKAVAMNGGGRSRAHSQNCGNVDATILIDQDDITNVDQQPRSIVARAALDKYLSDNENCIPLDIKGPSECIEYEKYSCDDNRFLAWCMTTKQGHSRQPEFSTEYFWEFLEPL
ncbi:MAG: PHB depolymerase family esterase [Oligoflexales bacterium]